MAGFSTELPSTQVWSPADLPEPAIALRSSVLPGEATEADWPEERRRGVRRFFVPVANREDSPEPLRDIGPETRAEPVLETARLVHLTIEGGRGQLPITIPVFESLGRQAPQREYCDLTWLPYEDSRPRLPEPILPAAWSHYSDSWTALGPIAALMEVVLGFTPNALTRTLHWQPPAEGPRLGVRNYPLGSATVNAALIAADGHWTAEIDTDRAITLELCWKGAWQTHACPPGRTAIRLEK